MEANQEDEMAQRKWTDIPSCNFIEGCLHDAISMIDSALGDGYAKQHPELIGSVTQAAAHIEFGLMLTKSAMRSVEYENGETQQTELTALRKQVGKLYGVIKDMERAAGDGAADQ